MNLHEVAADTGLQGMTFCRTGINHRVSAEGRAIILQMADSVPRGELKVYSEKWLLLHQVRHLLLMNFSVRPTVETRRAKVFALWVESIILATS